MSLIATRLDDSVSYGFQADPYYSTQIVPLENGKEVRNSNWTRAKRRYSASYTNFTPAQFALLLACFHAAKGSAYPFLFKDWTDFAATNEALGNTPGANSDPVQLIKTYTHGAASTVRTILNPTTVVVEQADGVGGWATKAGTYSATTGLFTPSSNWTASRSLRWTGEHDVAVRFASDNMPAQYDNYNAITTSVELVEDFL